MLNKEQVLAMLGPGGIQAGLDEMLGARQKGEARNRRSCYNKSQHSNGDGSPSLCVSPEGNYACKACGVKGDFFQMTSDIKGFNFKEALNYWARQSGTDPTPKIQLKRRKTVGKRKHRMLMPETSVNREMLMAYKRLAWMTKNLLARKWLTEWYGIRREDMQEWGLGWCQRSKRVLIPVPKIRVFDKIPESESEVPVYEDVLNIRKHDLLRYHCKWRPYGELTKVNDVNTKPKEIETLADLKGWKAVWTGKRGKVTGCTGFNSSYVFGIDALQMRKDVWLVAGELKVILLRRYGIASCCFTNGENQLPKDLLPLFAGKTVRILFDLDKAGRLGTDAISQGLIENGAKVIAGILPEEGLPYNGDVTDYMRLHEWDKKCLANISWSKIHGREETKKVQKTKFQRTTFAGLVAAKNLGRPVEVEAIIAGRGDTPFAVPRSAHTICDAGRNDAKSKCNGCGIAAKGFSCNRTFKDSEVIGMTGIKKSAVPHAMNHLLGIPKNCFDHRTTTEWASVERLVIVPPVEAHDDVKEVVQGAYKFRRHNLYHIHDGTNPVQDNKGYNLQGTIIGDPKDNSYVFAASNHKSVDNDVLSYRRSNVLHKKLSSALWDNCDDAKSMLRLLVKDMSENVLLKYEQDQMILVQMLSFFMPFRFKIRNHVCEKVCPEVLIIGPTRVGKSTMAASLTAHLGSGRYTSCADKPTVVGLIGGSSKMGGQELFSWGVIPTSDGSIVVFDEYNRIPIDHIRALTNIKSSGVASRDINSGQRRTSCAVRFLELANPRHGNAVEDYPSPIHCASDLVGDPQDVSRVDFLFFAKRPKNIKALNKFRDKKDRPEHRYTREVARYHLSWAWSLTSKKISWEDPHHLLEQADLMMKKVGAVGIIQPVEAKFKLGRMAIAVASLVFSFDKKTGGVIVLKEHVEVATDLYINVYSTYLNESNINKDKLPEKLLEILDRVEDPRVLRTLTMSDSWSRDDFDWIFEGKDSSKFRYHIFIDMQLVKRVGNRYVPNNKAFTTALSRYISRRLAEDK